MRINSHRAARARAPYSLHDGCGGSIPKRGAWLVQSASSSKTWRSVRS